VAGDFSMSITAFALTPKIEDRTSKILLEMGGESLIYLGGGSIPNVIFWTA